MIKTILWSVLIIAIFAPIAVRLYRKAVGIDRRTIIVDHRPVRRG